MAASNLNNLGKAPTTRTISWLDMVQRSWGGEFNAPDHRIYVFSNGRAYDSTDKSSNGIYNNNLGPNDNP